MTTKEAQGLPQDTLVAEIEAQAVGAESIGEDGIAGVLLQAAALIRSLSEANAALTQEETEWKEAVQGEYNRAEHHKLIRETAEAALSAATLEIERLKGALEPVRTEMRRILCDPNNGAEVTVNETQIQGWLDVLDADDSNNWYSSVQLDEIDRLKK